MKYIRLAFVFLVLIGCARVEAIHLEDLLDPVVPTVYVLPGYVPVPDHGTKFYSLIDQKTGSWKAGAKMDEPAAPYIVGGEAQ